MLQPVPVPLARYNKIVQAPRLAAEIPRNTDMLTQINGNHESEPLIRNAPELLINVPTISCHQVRTRDESFIRNAS